MLMAHIIYTGSKQPVLFSTSKGTVSASRENQQYLYDILEKLLRENIISGYQIVEAVGNPITSSDI